MKERVTLTLDAELISEIDATIDLSRIKNRSHAVELLLLQAIGSHKPKKAIILAGGKGERLKPITAEIPKPLIPLHGKPVIEHVIDLLRKYKIKDIILATGYQGDKIREYFGDGKKFGVSITYLQENKPLGTAGPIRTARHLLDSTFIVCNADELKDIDLFDMYLMHKENEATATIALTTVADPSMYGVARLKGSRILEFIEKPKKGSLSSKLINAGLYIMEPEIINYIPKGFSMLERDVFPKLAKRGMLYGYPFSGQWYDTGTMQRYEKAMKEWKDIN